MTAPEPAYIARIRQSIRDSRPRAKDIASKRVGMVIADYARMDNRDTIPVDKSRRATEANQ